MDRDLAARVAAEFDLGTVLAVDPLRAGTAEVVRLRTDRGAFVVKTPYRAWEVELYGEVERALNASGVRQARLLRTAAAACADTARSAVGSTGHSVQEWLPGTSPARPAPAQSAALMRYLARYDTALRTLRPPAALLAAESVWTQVVSPAFLLERLPALVARAGPAGGDRRAVAPALRHLEAALARLAALPRQLVHGDLGPDNVLWCGADVVAVLDFTPFHEPALFGLCTALYWCHVHGLPGRGPDGRPAPDLDRIGADLAAYDAARPLTGAEWAAVPAMLLREALRRVATPPAVADAGLGRIDPARYEARYAALAALTGRYADLPSRRSAPLRS